MIIKAFKMLWLNCYGWCQNVLAPIHVVSIVSLVAFVLMVWVVCYERVDLVETQMQVLELNTGTAVMAVALEMPDGGTRLRDIKLSRSEALFFEPIVNDMKSIGVVVRYHTSLMGNGHYVVLFRGNEIFYDRFNQEENHSYMRSLNINDTLK